MNSYTSIMKIRVYSLSSCAWKKLLLPSEVDVKLAKCMSILVTSFLL